MWSRKWVGSLGAVLGLVVAAGGCGRTRSASQDPGSSDDSGASGRGAHDSADTPGDALRGGSADGGSRNAGQLSTGEPNGDAGAGGPTARTPSGGGGSASAGGAAANTPGGAGESAGASAEGGAGGAGAEGGAGDADAEGGAGGADDAPNDIESCLANLVGPVTADIVSVRGHAGALGAVDYVIAGYSAGASGADGLQRFTDSYYGQAGTPADISDTGLWLWTQHDPVVVGTVYTSGYNVPASAQLSFRIFANSYATGVSCPVWGSGHFTFTQFQTGSVLASGGYDFQCPEADIDVRGCFRYAE